MTDSVNESSLNPHFSIRSNLIRTIVGLAILLALVSRNPLDPTPFNLLWPYDGVNNLLSLPGALFAGLLYELFGWCALAIPIYLLFLRSREPSRKTRQYLLNGLYFLLLVDFVALCFPTGNQYLNQITGFWGTVACAGLIPFPGRPIALILISLFLIGNLTEYRFNLQLIEIIRLFFSLMGWHTQRLFTICGSALIQLKQFWADLWRSNVVPFLMRQNSWIIGEICKIQGGFVSRLIKILPVNSFSSLFINSTELFKSRTDSTGFVNIGKNRIDPQTSAFEYKIFQEALKEFEDKYYQSYLAEPRNSGGR